MTDYDLIIKNARLYDGTGTPSYIGTIAVKDGKIAGVWEEDDFEKEHATAETAVYADGLCLAPGFIDSHSHADEVIFVNSEREQALRMGVTTEIAGQCGHTESPYPADVNPKFYQMASGNFGGRAYEDFESLAKDVSMLTLGTNQAWFTGHGALRTSVMGFENRKATDEEIIRMQEILDKEMQGGALGFSTGLAYVPGIYSDVHEISELGKVLKKYGGIYTSHTRSESAGIFDAVKEVIDVAKIAGIRGNISHFKACYPGYWNRMGEALRMVDRAIDDGVDITMDAYPYIAVSTTTLSAIPAKFLDQGAEAFAESLKDPAVVEAVRYEIQVVDDPSWDNALKHAGPDRFLVVNAAETPWMEGKTYTEIAKELHTDPFTAVMTALRENHGHITDVRFIMSEENVEKVLKHPVCTVGSDGIWKKGRDRTCHPRAFGTFPRYLGHYIRDRKILSREEGIRRITGLPANRYGLKGKGYLKPGFDADLVLFDYETIADGGDFKDPFRKNAGIYEVFVAGTSVLRENELTGSFCGRFIKRS